MQKTNRVAGKRLLKRSMVCAAAAAALPTFLYPASLHANTLTWDNNGVTAPNPEDGAGTWDTATQQWWDGTIDNIWNNANNDTAVFGAGGTGGTVTVSPGITLGGLTINTSSYTFSGGSFVFNTAGQISLTAGVGTIATPITGAGAVTYNVAPTSTLDLTGTETNSGTSTYTGGGTVTINAQTVIDSGGPLVLSGITLNGTGNPTNPSVPITIANNTTNTILLPNNGTFTGVISGGGTVIFGSGAKTYSFNGSGTNTFAGTITLNANAATIRVTNLPAGFPDAVINLGTGAGSFQNRTNAGTIQIGALFGGTLTSVTGSQNTSNSGAVDYEIGNAGVDSTYNGAILDGNAATRQTAISKIGNDTLTLSGTGTYTGNTTINGGTLALASATIFNATPNVFVNNAGSGALNVAALASGYTIPNGQALSGNGGHIVGTINVSNSTGVLAPGSAAGTSTSGTLTIDNLNINGGTVALDINGGVSDQINVGTSLTLTSGTVFISPNGATGTFPVITYPANSAHGSLSNISTLFASRVQSGSGLTDNPATGQISLNITGFSPAETLTWNGTANGNWDIQASGNWSDDLSANDKFFAGDNVNFLDTAGVQTTITKIGSLQPGTFVINSGTTNYTIGGAGTINGVGLFKTGLSTATLSSANSLTSVTLGGGTLMLADSNAVSSSATATISIGNGTLLLTGSGITVPNNINVFRDLSTIGGNGTFSGVVNDQGQLENHITNMLVPSGQTTSVASTTFGANFTGTLEFGASGGLFRFTGTSAVSTLGSFDLGTGSVIVATRDDNGGAIALGALAGGPNTTLQGAISTNGPVTYTIGQNGASTLFQGTLTDGTNAGFSDVTSLTKVGSGTLTLSGTNNYTGATQVSAGALIVNGPHNGGGTYTVAGGATFGGSGEISATLSLGGALAPGGSNATGALTVGTLITNGGNSIGLEVGGGHADELVVTGSNGLNLANAPANVSVSDLGNGTFGRYALIDYSGTALANLGSFSPNSGFTIAGVSASLVNNTLNTSVDLYVPNPAEQDSTWGGATSKEWTVNGNWLNNIAPNLADDVAIFTDANAGTITLASPQTVAFVNFNTTTGSYNISGANALNLAASGGYVGINVMGGNQTISAPVTLGNDAVFAVIDNASLTVSGNISGGTVALTKSGNGTLTLSGTNTYSGPTNLTAGELVVSSSTNLGDASGTNGVNLEGGTLKILSPFTSPASRPWTMLVSTTLDTTANTVEIDGALTGDGTLTDTGDGTLILTGNNSGFIGALSLNSGTLLVANTTNLGGSGAGNRLVFNGGAMIMTGTYNSARNVILSQNGTIDTNANTGTISGTISGAGGLTEQGAGTLSLTGVNTYTGLTSLNGGVVQINADTALGGGNGTATVSSSSTSSNSVTLTSIPAGFTIGTSFLGSTVTGINATTDVATLAANANTALTGGTASFSTALPITINGAALVTIGTVSLSEAGTVGVASSENRNITIGSAGATLSAGSDPMTVPGVISGTGALFKGGSGSVTLSGSSTFVGNTTIGSGTLIINSNASLGDPGNALIFNGGALRASTSISFVGSRAVQTSSSGTIDTNGFSVSIPVGISGSGSLSKTGTGTLTFAGNNTYSGGTNVGSGLLIANKLSDGTLTITGGEAQVVAQASNNNVAGTSVVPALSISGGSLDLTNNALIIDYSGTLGTQLSDVRTALSTAHLVSSTNTGSLAIGYADAAAIGRTSFAGVAVDSTAVVVGDVIAGDANLDGKVNASDFDALAANYGNLSTAVWQQGDFNYDGIVNTLDFNILASHYNMVQSAGAPAPALGTLVPEPATIAWIALAGLIRPRKRRN